jgi:hypothetical protein
MRIHQRQINSLLLGKSDEEKKKILKTILDNRIDTALNDVPKDDKYECIQYLANYFLNKKQRAILADALIDDFVANGYSGEDLENVKRHSNEVIIEQYSLVRDSGNDLKKMIKSITTKKTNNLKKVKYEK